MTSKSEGHEKTDLEIQSPKRKRALTKLTREGCLPLSLQEEFGLLLKHLRSYRSSLRDEEKEAFACESNFPLPPSLSLLTSPCLSHSHSLTLTLTQMPGETLVRLISLKSNTSSTLVHKSLLLLFKDFSPGSRNVSQRRAHQLKICCSSLVMFATLSHRK
jgi:hypothetical protein